MLSEKKIACMYRGMIALRKLETHRKCERRMRKKVGADLGAGASEMPYIYIYIGRRSWRRPKKQHKNTNEK